jgi:hypothetical protein
MKIRTEKRFNNAISLMRGPLYFSLRIAKTYDTLKKATYENYGYKGSIDWKITPSAKWNYGLLIDLNDPSRGLKITDNQIGRYPFADKGDPVWSADSGKYVTIKYDPPVIIKARGLLIPGWTMMDNSAAQPPASPVAPQGDPVIIELVPYGCARLRITEFPRMDVTLMQDMMRPARQ